MRLSRAAFLTAMATTATLGLAACTGSNTNGTKSADTGTTGAANGEVITVEHAFGTTEIPAQVERIATVNWANQDVPLALGVLPVGFAAQSWAVEDGSGMLIWTKEKVEELGGADSVTLFDETDGIDFEAVAATSPDLILAAYSGLSEEEYQTLSQIAPTVAYPKDAAAWTTPWRSMITMNGTAMGKAAEAEALVAELEAQIAAEVAKYPQLAGKNAAFFYTSTEDLSKISVYSDGDPRTAFLADLGLSLPESVKALDDGSGNFYFEISAEEADTFNDVDLMVLYGEATDLATYQADPLLGAIPAIKNGSVVFLGNGPLAASANPGPLSLPWGIEEYVSLLAAAADSVA